MKAQLPIQDEPHQSRPRADHRVDWIGSAIESAIYHCYRSFERGVMPSNKLQSSAVMSYIIITCDVKLSDTSLETI